MNRLHFGDCLTVMQDMPLASVDLIYLDPPFNSQRQYNSIYKDETGRPLPEQIDAFCDMWELNDETEEAIRHTPTIMERDHGIDKATADFWRLWMNALRDTNPRLLAYLSYMVQRLLQMKTILKPTGSIYLHCDPTVSHYVKVMMDAIFGYANFRNEIVWHYYNKFAAGRRVFGRNYDQILFYSRGKSYYFEPQRIPRDKPRRQLVRENVGGVLKNKRGPDGKVMYRTVTDKKMDAVWAIPALQHASRERLGYATQKPVKLLERIIKASCPPDGVVLDPFCGCATTLEAAQNLGRKWIGIDIAIHAVKRITRQRLVERLGLVEDEDFEITGIPQTAEGALDLWTRDKRQFQVWAVELAEGFVTKRQSGDGGIDGRLWYDVPGERELGSMVIEVKGGRTVNINVVRELRGVLEREERVQLAGLIVQHELRPRQRANFAREMGKAGEVEIGGVAYPRMQLLTVANLLDGKRFQTPHVMGKHQLQPAIPGISR